MSFSLPQASIKEIADYLDAGMLCFYHIPTGNLEYFPDDSRGHAGFDPENWQDVMDEVENNYHEYLRFEGMENHESFRLMENFVASIAENGCRHQFEKALSSKKPFRQFKELLHNFPLLRQQWFDYKSQRYIDWVKEQVPASVR